MKFYRSPLDSGGFEYARDHGDSGSADYFDDELRIWVACESSWTRSGTTAPGSPAPSTKSTTQRKPGQARPSTSAASSPDFDFFYSLAAV